MAETIDPTPAATTEPTVAPAVDAATTPETPENLTHAQLAELAALTGDAPPEAIEEPEPVVEPEAAPEEISESVQTSEDDTESVPTSPEPEVVEPEPVAETPATPAATKPPTPETPAQVDPSEQRVARLAEIDAELTALEASADYDPFEDQKKINKLVIEQARLTAADAAEARASERQRKAEETHWNNVDASNPYLPKGRARQLWDEFHAAAKKDNADPVAAHAVAAHMLKERVKLLKAQADAKKKTPVAPPAPAPARTAPTAPPRKAPVTPPGQVIPTGAGVPHRPPQPQPKTQDEMIARLAQMAGDPHDHFNR